MRTLVIAVALVAAVIATTVAPVAAAPSGSPSAYPCKVLRKALKGTQIGNSASTFDPARTTTVSCSYTGGNPIQWVAYLILRTSTPAGGPRATVKAFCGPMVSAGHAEWSDKGRTGADLACGLMSADNTRRTTNAYFAKGRWYGELHLVTPPSAGGLLYSELLIKKVTSQLR